jgi:hypothetical protein
MLPPKDMFLHIAQRAKSAPRAAAGREKEPIDSRMREALWAVSASGRSGEKPARSAPQMARGDQIDMTQESGTTSDRATGMMNTAAVAEAMRGKAIASAAKSAASMKKSVLALYSQYSLLVAMVASLIPYPRPLTLSPRRHSL